MSNNPRPEIHFADFINLLTNFSQEKGITKSGVLELLMNSFCFVVDTDSASSTDEKAGCFREAVKVFQEKSADPYSEGNDL